MAVPTYDELLSRYGVEDSSMEQTFHDNHLRAVSFELGKWERIARCLGIPSKDIEMIKSQGDAEEQRDRMLECWKQRCGSKATYSVLVKALLQVNRTDLAEKVVSLRLTPPDQSLLSPREFCVIPTSLLASESSLRVEDNVYTSTSISVFSPTNSPCMPVSPVSDVTPTLMELEEDFYELVTYVETTLENNKVKLSTLTKRFRMLPQSVRRQHETDVNYATTRQRVLDSKTTKALFDNLTALKHWSFMMPDTLAHIIKDVKIEGVRKRIDTYQKKLSTFKTNTKLRDLIGTNFPVPDYCMELTLKVEGWENKTIEEVEKNTMNIIRRATYNGLSVGLGWKGVFIGSVKLMFILMQPIDLSSDMLLDICTGTGVINIQIDGVNVYDKGHSRLEEVPGSLWYSTRRIRYSIGGERDVLIVAADQTSSHSEAVARKPGKLTQEDKQTLQSQGVHLDCQDELAILRSRYQLDKKKNVVGIQSKASLHRDEVMKCIQHFLSTTKKDGAVLYYIGAGRRNTGDWCFQGGFITFRELAQLYLHLMRGRVLTIISDCSYSGCWVRDCMEFFDEQGVQPCGHRAREKGILIKMLASCKSNEIPTEYRYLVSGAINEPSGEMSFLISKQLLETQTTVSVDSTHLRCYNKTIDAPCTLQAGYTYVNIH